MNYTQAIGNLNELKCINAFIELGHDVAIPYGNNAKYDFLVDDGKKIWKIQCKSSNYSKRKDGTEDINSFFIETCSQTTNTKKSIRHKYNSNDVDYFATFFNNKVYLIPSNECTGVTITLRTSPPKNGNKYRDAQNYELSNFFNENEQYLESKNVYLNR